MAEMRAIVRQPEVVLYEVPESSRHRTRVFIASTRQSRAIANDPFICGVTYTAALEAACSATIGALKTAGLFSAQERTSTVLHILRGGLNFGLRGALATSLGWNEHSSAFVSAQRVRKTEDPHEWFITEHSYRKIYLGEINDLIFGDVVATGTSLEYGLSTLRAAASTSGRIRSLTFFTIGGARSHAVLDATVEALAAPQSDPIDAKVIYFEGIFSVPSPQSPLRIKIDGTDLVRRDAVLAPEFVESHYEQPTYALERCAIYDAGSRAFSLCDYWNDVREYWQQVRDLAREGVSFSELLSERFPALNPERFGAPRLLQIAENHLARMAMTPPGVVTESYA